MVSFSGVLNKGLWILIPLIAMFWSVCYDIYFRVCSIFQWLLSSPRRPHNVKVRGIQQQVKEWLKTDQSIAMCTARPAWKSISPGNLNYKNRMYKVFIENMTDVLALNEKDMTVKVESMITIGDLSRYLAARGYCLPVVPELDDLTVAGLVAGGGIETTSKKYGLFHDICTAYDVVLGDASVVKVDKDNYSDLFEIIPFTYGTLGFIVAVEIQIIPLKPYVQLSYYGVNAGSELTKEIEKACHDDNIDIVEGIVYDEKNAILMVGKFVDNPAPGTSVNNIGLWFKPFFYSHAKKFLKHHSGFTECIPTSHYHHRHNKPIFWCIEDLMPCANHPVFRHAKKRHRKKERKKGLCP